MEGDDEFEDEPILDTTETSSFEKELFAAIRESRRLDAEIDEELHQLIDGKYPEPPPSTRGGVADDDG